MYQFLILLVATVASANEDNKEQSSCKLEVSEMNEIVPDLRKILDESYRTPFYGSLYSEVFVPWVDLTGARPPGSKALDDAIATISEDFDKAGLITRLEKVRVPYWYRDSDTAHITKPVHRKLNVLSFVVLHPLFYNPAGLKITAPLTIITSYNQLQAKMSLVVGHIIFIDAKFSEYKTMLKFIKYVEEIVSEKGAKGILIRSFTPYSLSTPHTGSIQLLGKIPVLAVTLEDAKLIRRIEEGIAKNEEIEVSIKVSSKSTHNTSSHNIVADLSGSDFPDEYVVLSAHIDSLDVGQGAVDNAAGAFVIWRTAILLTKLINENKIPPPSRTIRFILFTGTEYGNFGSKTHVNNPKNNITQWVAAIQSHSGVYRMKGFKFKASESAFCVLEGVSSKIPRSENYKLVKMQEIEGDLDIINRYGSLGIPMGEPYLYPNNYYYYHHSHADTVATINGSDIDEHVRMLAMLSYSLGRLQTPLPST